MSGLEQRNGCHGCGVCKFGGMLCAGHYGPLACLLLGQHKKALPCRSSPVCCRIGDLEIFSSGDLSASCHPPVVILNILRT